MKLAIARISTSERRKLASILLAVVVFALLTSLTTLAFGRPVINGLLVGIIVGTSVGLFEQFYVQSSRGRWFRSIHPLKSMLIYAGIVAVIFLLSIHLEHLILWNFTDLNWVYRRLPLLVPIVVAFSMIGVVVIRVAHFIGLETLFHLTVGTYHRPVVEKKVLMFLDINDSTALSTQLGAVETKSFVGKFLFDISAPITDNGGEIYLYKGDGLIALWGWDDAVSGDKILHAIDAVFAAVEHEHTTYLSQFGSVPAFRIGVHGGEVVVSEQGDTKRAIGIYGTPINIAERMEEAAKAHGVACVISGDVAEAFSEPSAELVLIGHEQVRGLAIEIPIFEYRVAFESAAPTDASSPCCQSEVAHL
jgi:adenylate cyclase